MKKAIATLCGVFIGAWAGTLTAAQPHEPAPPTPLSISNAPMLVDGRVPAPNVFLAIDNGRHALPADAAWHSAFAAEHAPDGVIRLAWQAAGGCEAIPDPGMLCRGRNGLAALDEGRRRELDRFLETAGKASAQQGESSLLQHFLDTVLAYLQQHDAPVPDPATNPKPSEPLKCRQSFLLLASPLPGAESRPPASGSNAPPLVVRTVDTSESDPARSIRASVDTVLAESQSLPGQTIASVVAGSATPASAGWPILLYAARYNAGRWSGEITVQAPGASSAPWGMREGQAQPHTSASLLDERDPGTRVIMTSTGQGETLGTAAFRWERLAPWQQTALDDGDAAGQQRLDYLRGDRSREESQGGVFRNRDSRQADSVNSALWHAEGDPASAQAPAGPAMLYVGTNGGMLHAFSARTGTEIFAYVPQGLYSRLALLTRPSYRHAYFVDGSPWTAEVDDAGRRKTLLAGFLGAGGRGYFVLDVSHVSGPSEDALAAASLVLLDTTGASDPDIGHIAGDPVREPADGRRTRQITRLNNGRWALVLGNGYASEGQRAVLLIQFLDGARELVKLPAGSPGGKGLAAARLVDIDGDEVPDLAYAGDLLGQLWKFDLGASDATGWKVALDGRPLMRARNAAGTSQPITATPLSMPHPSGGRMIVFGTGRMLSDEDRASAGTQSIYGIHDRDGADPVPAGRSALLQQAIEPAQVGMVSGRKLWTSTNHAFPPPDAQPLRGWYLDLPSIGERVIANPVEYEGKLVDVLSMAPPAAFRMPGLPESCSPPSTLNFRTTLNALDGARPRSDLYGDAVATFNASRIELGNEPSVQINHGRQARTLGWDGKEEPPRSRLGMVARRAAWRQLQ